MAGMPGAGKTTLARALASIGFVMICPDEEMFREPPHPGIRSVPGAEEANAG
ncbi:hypothetical protein [Streptomyces sp. NPDC090112]|uniref:hypothetical protein n=1 Tax=Streptomyces sp. NPDC090112 TaxID=3365949 RepID=UPI003825AD96